MLVTLNVNIQAPELAGAIQAIANALVVSKAGALPEQKGLNTNSKTQKPVQTTAPVTEEPTTGEDPKTEVIPTVVELREKAQEKAKTAEGKKAIKALLDEFESKSISDVPEEKRAAFLVALEAL